MKALSMVLAMALCSTATTAMAAQKDLPQGISCLVTVVEDLNTKVEEVVSRKLVLPEFEAANLDGQGYEVLMKEGDVEVGVALSFLRYTPLLDIVVKANKTTISSGLKAVVTTDENSGLSTVFECSYVPGTKK